MTKDELDYERMLKQMEDLQKKLANKKDILDKERDAAIIRAIHEIDITREQGFLLANILSNGENLESILKLSPKVEEKPKKTKIKLNKIPKETVEVESEVVKDEA